MQLEIIQNVRVLENSILSCKSYLKQTLFVHVQSKFDFLYFGSTSKNIYKQMYTLSLVWYAPVLYYGAGSINE